LFMVGFPLVRVQDAKGKATHNRVRILGNRGKNARDFVLTLFGYSSYTYDHWKK
jgi:hypothetical protein